jgi:hypothetical protein
MADEVRIEEQAVSNELGAWDTAAQNLESEYQTKAQIAFDKFHGASWAGGDHAGEEFRGAIKVDQVNDLINPKSGQGSQIVQKVVELGTNTRDAINNSLASDQAQSTELKKPQGKL